MKKNNLKIKMTLSLVLFIVISLISIYSSQNISSDNIGNIFVKQVIFYIIGIIILLISSYYKDVIIKYNYLSYIGLLFLLALLLFLGVSINGSRCWLFIGPISFQPSEFMKISLIILTANYLSKSSKKKSLKTELIILLKLSIFFLLPAILTFLEPDTGAVIIYYVILISMILYRGINKKWYYIFLITITIISSSITLLYIFKHDLLINILGESLFYRIERILNWSNGSGYQLENSLIAIGSSGLKGFGFNNTPLYFPESSTDFIFTTFSSNFGFLGVLFLIIIIITFDTSILSLCKRKIAIHDKYLLVGIFSMLLYQQVQNISMTIGLLPITGITLPFISYGGSSLLSYMLAAGFIFRICHDNKKYMN